MIAATKWVAACLGITPVAELSHELETLLDRARQNVPLDQSRMADVVMRGIDRLRGLIEWLAPLVSREMRNESMVPQASLP